MNGSSLRIPLAVCAGFLILGLFRLNDLSLYTDSTRYLIWGTSIASLDGYADVTQPVTNRFVMNAPLYPLLLAPVLLFAPFSLLAAKIWTLLWGAAALALLFLWLRRQFGDRTSLTGTLLLACNPLFLVTSTEVLSEAPFLVFLLVVLLSMESYLRRPLEDRKTPWILIVSLSSITLLREVGAAIVLAGLVAIFRKKDLRTLLLTAGGTTALFLLWTIRNSLIDHGGVEGQMTNLQYILGHFVTNPNESLTAEFLLRAWLNLKGYVAGIGGMMFFPFPENLIGSPSVFLEAMRSLLTSGRVILFGIVVVATAAGLRKDVRTEAGVFRATALWIYILIILLYPVHDIRFLLPLLPLIFFYVLGAYEELRGMFRRPALVGTTGAAVLVFAFIPNVVATAEILVSNSAYRADPEGYSRSAAQPSAAHYYGQPWNVLGEWIGERLPEDAVIASPAKEIAAFVAPRKILETSRVLPPPVFERILRDHDAGYLITTKTPGEFETYQIAARESRRLWFVPLTSAGRLTLYEIRSAILNPPSDRPLSPDTTTAAGLMLAGREILQSLRYEQAVELLSRSRALAPNEPEPHFQLLTAFAMAGDSVAALQTYERLFTIPRSTAYTQIARTHLGTMNVMLAAQRATGPVQYGYLAFESGLSYWGLGFPSAALRIMTNVVETDSTNFVGALWGVHIAKQKGDTLLSNRFLERLKRIDITAQIVGDWDAVRTLEEALRSARTPNDRIRLLSAIARIYTKIELFDEALDVLERALVADPGNLDVWLQKAEVFEQKRANWGAYRVYSEILEREPHNSYARERLDSLKIDL